MNSPSLMHAIIFKSAFNIPDYIPLTKKQQEVMDALYTEGYNSGHAQGRRDGERSQHDYPRVEGS